MKKLLLLLLFIPIVSFGQSYSTYYGKVNVNSEVNATIDQNVNVNKTVTTIDYGALILANAQREKNRLESRIYNDAKLKNQAIEIANNPVMAFDYGTDNNWVMKKKRAQNLGFSKGTRYYHKIPNKILFSRINNDYRYRNESDDGVVSEIHFGSVQNRFTSASFLDARKEVQEENRSFLKRISGSNLESFLKKRKGKSVGTVDSRGLYTHKEELDKAMIFGKKGFKQTYFTEDDYEYMIRENYLFSNNDGLVIQVSVKYNGNKKEINFEMLEGRRAYFKRLFNKMIATASLKLGKKGYNK
tara:strand:+ start:179 stop:1078 length:900 start_codon:yes stop_codon:yes gene_type:complete